MQQDPQKVEDATKEQIKEYRELQAVADDAAFTAYLELQLKRTAEKILTLFIGAGVNNWDEFCKVRGEVIARLQPIQEIYSIESIIAHLEQQLEGFKQDQ